MFSRSFSTDCRTSATSRRYTGEPSELPTIRLAYPSGVSSCPCGRRTDVPAAGSSSCPAPE